MTHYLGIPCPRCQQGLRVRDEYVGQTVCCRFCNQSFTVEAPTEPSPAGAPDANLRNGAVVESTNPSPPRGARLGDFELIEEIGRVGMVALFTARQVGEGRLVTLRVETKVLGDDQAKTELEALRDRPGEWVIPGYQLLEKLSDGAMGRIYRALQTRLDRVVAIKVLHRSLLNRSEFRARFEHEAKLAARISHPRFIPTIEAGEVNGHPYFVMEYVEGETLEDLLTRHPVIQEKAAATIVLGVAEALRYLKEQGLVHRDIKPANILLTREGGVKLFDLGLARLTADEDWAMAEAGKAIGTPYYISPEQACARVDVDIRSDIYSLGTTFYRMVTGRVPYTGETTSEVLHKHVDKDTLFIPPEQVNRALSRHVGAVVTRMMARSREDRYPDPEALILDLQRLLADDRPDAGNTDQADS